jgi:hypothetical protein
MAVVRNLKVMLRQMLNHFVCNSVIVCNIIPLQIIYLIIIIIIKFDIAVFN